MRANETVINVTLQPSYRSRDRAQLSRLLAPRVRKELELRDGVVGTAGQSKSAECRRITRRQAQSRVDDPDPSEVSSTMPKRINLREAGLRRSVRQAKIRAQRDDKEALTTRATKRKAHVAFGKTAQRVITLFALFLTSVRRINAESTYPSKCFTSTTLQNKGGRSESACRWDAQSNRESFCFLCRHCIK